MQKEYESAEAVAARLGVSVRAVQKWANEGRFEGAYRVGRAWLIPVDAKKGEKRERNEDINLPSIVLPLMHSSSIPSTPEKLSELFDDDAVAAIALAEYYYYSGEPEKTAEICELYIDNDDISISISAAIMYLFSNLVCGKSHLAQLGLEVARIRIETLKNSPSRKQKAYSIFTNVLLSTLLNLEYVPIESIQDAIGDLPEPCRFFCCYMMAHDAYVKGDINRSIAMADAAVTVGCEKYPIIAVYIYMILTSAYMDMKDIETAKRAFMRGWEIAHRSKMLVVVTEHYDMVRGMADICLHKNALEELRIISRLGEDFSVAFRQLQNIEKNMSVAEHFKPEEISVAGLYRRGWSVKEISDYLGLAPRTVKHIISVIYEKLDISSRGELLQYFIR